MIQPDQLEKFNTELSTNEVITTVVVNSAVQKKGRFAVKKRVKRIVKRFLKKNNSFGSVLASRKFRLGALLLLVGILGAISINIFSLAQIFGWLSGLIAFGGLILMIWSLIEHS